MERSADRVDLQQRLTEIEAKVEGVRHQIDEQRDIIAKLESADQPTDHAKYLLAGLELLEAAYRGHRNEIIAGLSKFLD